MNLRPVAAYLHIKWQWNICYLRFTVVAFVNVPCVWGPAAVMRAVVVGKYILARVYSGRLSWYLDYLAFCLVIIIFPQ